MTYEEFKKAADAHQDVAFSYRLDSVIASAWCNASETKNAQDIEPLFIESLICLLAYCDDQRVLRWFAKHGITA